MRLLTCARCSRAFKPTSGCRGLCPNCTTPRDNRTPEYRANRAVVLAKATHCHWCRRPLDGNATADHVIPTAHGGSDEVTNLVPCCGPCNSRRGARVRARTTTAPKRTDPFGSVRLT